MRTSHKTLVIGAFAVLAAFGSAAASAADHWNGGGTEAVGQSTSMPAMSSTAASREVDQGAMAAARPSGTEAIGQSTSAPAMLSKVSNPNVYAGAVAAAHPSGTEAIGQSTSMPMTH